MGQTLVKRRPLGLPAPAPAVRLRRARAAATRSGLDRQWQVWLVNNRLRGALPEQLVEALFAEGVPRHVAAREVLQLEQSGALHVCRWHVEQQKRLMRRLQVMNTLRGVAGGIERRPTVDAQSFFDGFYATNTPLVLTEALADWPALSKWSPQYFIDHYGDAPLRVMEGRDRDVRAERAYEPLSRDTTLGEFAARVLAAGKTNDFYAVARNNNARQSALEALRADVRPPAELFRDGADVGRAQSFWFGPQGTVTALHHDPTNILFCQVYGSKRVHLAPPSDLQLFQRAEGFFSSVLGEPDSQSLPGTPVFEVTLSPGEALFIPALWWHRVESLSVSISYSLLHFHAQNAFPGYAP